MSNITKYIQYKLFTQKDPCTVTRVYHNTTEMNVKEIESEMN